MIFSKRYKDLLVNGDDVPNTINFIGDIDYFARKGIVGVLKSFNEPKKVKISRYSNETSDNDAFTLALMKLNQELGYDLFNFNALSCNYGTSMVDEQLIGGNLNYLFDVIELQHDFLSSKEKCEFTKNINSVLNECEISWMLVDGKMTKVDAKQFECDIKRKTLEKMKELSDCDSKFKPAFEELQKAIEFYNKEDYSESITNANKCYESVMKVIMGTNDGNAGELTNNIKNKLELPSAINKNGFKDRILMSLPYLRNELSSHGAGSEKITISKSLANLALNLAASLCTFVIEDLQHK